MKNRSVGNIRIYLLLPLTFILFIMTGCEQAKKAYSDKPVYVDGPPELSVTVNNNTFYAVRGSYSWGMGNNPEKKIGLIVDCAPAPELVKDRKPTSAKSGSQIQLNFQYEPLEMKVSLWKDKNKVEQPLSSGSVTLPDRKGSYIYELYARWEEGSAYYGFSVKTE